MTNLLGNRWMLALSVTAVMAYGVLVGMALGTFARLP
jgi:hypothetical protein